MINAAVLGRYRIQEFIQFISNTLIIVKQHGAEKLKVKALYNVLSQHHIQLQEAYKQDTNSEITPQLTSLDTQRDQMIICLRQICEGYTHHPNEKLKAAGSRIVACIDKYGSKLYQLNYNAETASLKNLIRDLQTNPDCVAAIQDLDLEEVVKEMNIANINFEKLFIQRLGEFSQNGAKSTKELVQLTSEAYRTLAQHVTAHATLTPSEGYTSLIKHLNENIDHFNHIVDRRKGTGVPQEADGSADESETVSTSDKV